jgi:tripartite tricarboxylate transporter family receptor
MNTGRRKFLLGTIAALAAPVAGLPAPALAQQKPLRIVVPYTPGGSADIMARAFGSHLAARSGRAVVVENKPGATGTIGTQAVARSAPNGETILQSDIGPMSIQPAAGRPGYAPSDFAPIARLVTDPVVLATRAGSPALAAAAGVDRDPPRQPAGRTPGRRELVHDAPPRRLGPRGPPLAGWSPHIPGAGGRRASFGTPVRCRGALPHACPAAASCACSSPARTAPKRTSMAPGRAPMPPTCGGTPVKRPARRGSGSAAP